MSDSGATRIASWLAEQTRTEHRSGRVVRVELRHLNIGNDAGEVVAIEEAPEGADSAWAQTMGVSLARLAAEDSNAIAQGVQRYAVQVFRDKSAAGKAAARVIVAVDHERTDTTGFSEPATAAGALAQSMRHIEAKERSVTALMQVLLIETRSRYEALALENAKLREQHDKAAELVDELVGRRQERELEAEAARAKAEMLREAGSQVKLLLPVVANRIAGRQVIPAGNPEEATARGLFESLTPEQKSELVTAIAPVLPKLTTAQQIAIAELVRDREPN